MIKKYDYYYVSHNSNRAHTFLPSTSVVSYNPYILHTMLRGFHEMRDVSRIVQHSSSSTLAAPISKSLLLASNAFSPSITSSCSLRAFATGHKNKPKMTRAQR